MSGMSTEGLRLGEVQTRAAKRRVEGCGGYRQATAPASAHEDAASSRPVASQIPGVCPRSCCSLLAFFVGALFSATGCAAVPPVPATANTRPPGTVSSRVEDDEDGGWLFERLTGRRSSASRAEAASGVVPASASEPVVSPPAAPAVSGAERKSDDDSGFEWSDLSPDKVLKNLKKAAGLGPNEGLAQALLDDGKKLYEQKKYAEAAEKFKSAAARWPDSILEEDALFWRAESYFFCDEYPKAQDAYDNLLKKYDNSRYLDTAVKRLFSIGRYWEQLEQAHAHWPVTPNLTDKERPWFDTFGNALKAYETVRMKDPTGPLADDSIMATANAYFAKGRYEDASYYYDLLRKEYPRSDHQLQAHVLGLQSKLRVYQGKLYDGTPLSEADEIAEQTLTQFRSQLGSEQERLAQVRNGIREQQAERDWAVAQYYDRKKQYAYARLYYQYIIHDYPLTQTAQKARARLDQIRNEPDQPPNRFKWLSDLLPAEG
jgi:outer membrane protein assembly factor BamD (BamD/ComL family)